MTAHASPSHLIGKALPDSSLCLSESGVPQVLLVGDRSLGLDACADICTALEMQITIARTHHDLPFRLHHARPIAALIDLPTDSRAISSALRCIAAYDQDLPIRLITDATAAALGTTDAARELWSLTELDVITPDRTARALMPFLFHAARLRGVGRFIRVG